MKVRVGAATDIGKARERNEDAYLVEHPVFAVADGMGGHRGGREASKLAMEVLAEMKEGTGEDRLAEQIRQAGRTVFERSHEDHALAGMGTTTTAVMVEGTELHLAHVGDSRAYLLRDGSLRLLTHDHTLVQRMVNEGRLTEAEAQVHPQRSVLTRALGIDEDVQVDEGRIEVQEGDRLVLCTDGLTSMISSEQTEEILKTSPDPQDAADRLVEAANGAGGLDNITVVVVDFEPGDGVEGPATTVEGVTPVKAQRAGRGRLWRRVALAVGAALIVIAAGLVALRFYLDRQWFVGADSGKVTIFQGIPTKFMGFKLYHPVRQTRVPASRAVKLEPYRDLRDGITVDGRDGARKLIDQMLTDLRHQRRAARKGTK
jgi:protein phosphatase